MYKVFLVDDEELVIKSLKASVNWNEYGFEVIGFALDASEAYVKILELKPDIVFTDVRMPGSSGLELIKNIKERDMNTIFIVVSGYAEFAYAQKAMNYGALGYCLKPFDDIEIITFLKKAKSIIDATKKAKHIQLMDLIEENDKQSQNTIKDILSESDLTIGPKDKVNILVSIGKKKLIFYEKYNILTLKVGYEKYAYFTSESELNCIRKRISQKPEGVKGIGLSKTIDNISLIKTALHQAEVAAYSYFTAIGNNKVIFEEKSEGIEKLGTMKSLEESINRNDIPNTVKALESAMEQFDKGQLNMKHALIIYNNIMVFLSRLKNTEFEDYIYNFDKLAAVFSDVKNMLDNLKQFLLDELNIKYEYSPPRILNQTFKAILNYINENYCKDISAQSISKDFNVNSNYFSQLFRKELGIAFTEYLTKLRMEYACKLLKTTDIPVSEISEQVGYNDYFYFSRVFKKVIGKSPSTYRLDFFVYQ